MKGSMLAPKTYTKYVRHPIDKHVMNVDEGFYASTKELY